MNFNFDAKNVATGFVAPTIPTTAAAPMPGFQLGVGSGDSKVWQPPKVCMGFGSSLSGLPAVPTLAAPAPTTAATGFSFQTAPQPSNTAPQLNFGIINPSTAAKLPFATPTNTTAATAAPLAFNLGSVAKPTSVAAVSSSGTPTLSFKLPTSISLSTTAPPASTASPGFSLASTTVSTGFSLASTTTAFQLPSATSTPTISAITAPTLATSTVTTESAIPSTGNLTFGQLEDAINKWTIDLDEQGKLFGNQAKQLNAWDRLLISNSEKILTLNNGIERVKQQQQQLDQELDFVLAQQKELEDLILPLEKELNDLPPTDLDRNQTYQMAENLNSQLKQMSEDLKEVIEHLNEANKNQELSNPITQIGKILNAHMNSLQWIDRNTSKISAHLDQISKMHDMNRRNHEMSLQRTYDDL